MRFYRLGVQMGAFALILACGADAGGGERLELGSTAPMSEVKMKNVGGGERSISEVKGENGTLVIFSCNSCPWVVAWEDRIAEIGSAYEKKGFGVIVINANDPQQVPDDGFEEMIKRSKDRGFAFPYVVDTTSDVARAFGATRTPEVFLFDKGGLLVYHGAIDDNAKNSEGVEIHYLKDALEAVLQGKEIGRKGTKALGCSIKFRPKT